MLMPPGRTTSHGTNSVFQKIKWELKDWVRIQYSGCKTIRIWAKAGCVGEVRSFVWCASIFPAWMCLALSTLTVPHFNHFPALTVTVPYLLTPAWPLVALQEEAPEAAVSKSSFLPTRRTGKEDTKLTSFPGHWGITQFYNKDLTVSCQK